MILAKGWPVHKIVMGMVTNPENGSGYVGFEAIAALLPVLVNRHPGFGGVSGWEYFNSLPGGREKPWLWAEWMHALLRGEGRQGHVLEDVKKGVAEEKRMKDMLKPVDPEGDEGKDAPVPGEFQYYSDGLDED